MPAVAEVNPDIVIRSGKKNRNQEALEAQKNNNQGKYYQTNKHKNSNKRCIVLATGERAALEKQR